MTRVLIVEDEESFAEPLAFLLRKEGFSTAIAVTDRARSRSSTATVPTSCCWTSCCPA